MPLKNKSILFVFLWLFVLLAAGVVYAQSDLASSSDKKKADTPSSSDKKKTGTFVGRIMSKGVGSMAGGKIYLFDTLNGPPNQQVYSRVPVIIGDTDPDGKFAIEAPAGTYFIMVLKRAQGEVGLTEMKTQQHTFFGFDYKGPKEYAIKEGEQIDLGVWDFYPTLKGVGKPTSTIKGTITNLDGKPVEKVNILAFEVPKLVAPPFCDSYTDKDGKYFLSVAKGTYYLRVKTTLDPYGEKEPVVVAVDDNEIKSVDLKVEGKGLPAPTVIQGTITDLDGKPVANMFVSAFATPQKETKPVFVSTRSDKDGKYFLKALKGTYYLRIRSNLWGSTPTVGQIVDSYGEKDPVAVTVNDGETKTGINLKVESFPGRGPFPDQGPKYGRGPKEDTVIKPGAEFWRDRETGRTGTSQGQVPTQKIDSGPGAVPGPPEPPPNTVPRQ